MQLHVQMTFTGLRKGHGHDYDVSVNTEDDNSSEDVKDPSTGASKAQVTIRLNALCPCQNDHLRLQIGTWGADTYRNVEQHSLARALILLLSYTHCGRLAPVLKTIFSSMCHIIYL